MELTLIFLGHMRLPSTCKQILKKSILKVKFGKCVGYSTSGLATYI